MAAETNRTPSSTASARHRPKSFTVFAAAFIAGAAAAVGVNRVLDVQLAQRRPQVECEPIFVALRTLPQGAPVTVWDVALKDWPKAMLPSSALRAGDTFDGYVLRHAVREGQPLLAVQLVKSGAATPATPVATEAFTPAMPASVPTPPPATSTQADPWMPAESIVQPAPAVIEKPTTAATKPTVKPSVVEPAPEHVPAPAPTADTVATLTTTAPAAAETAPIAPQTVPVVEDAVVAAEAEPVATAPAPVAPVAQPTIASSGQPMPPSPTDIDPPVRSEPTLGTRADVDELAEAVATDVQTMPSVMTAKGQPTPRAARPSPSDAGRYLVVPERIALQADTSFTTPRPEPPGPPATVTQPPVAAPRPQPPVAQPATAPAAAARRPSQPKAPAGRNQQPPRVQPPKPQPQPAKGDQKQATAAPRTWSGMFPNVAAGIESMASPWQRSRPAAQQATPASQQTRR